MPDRPATFAAMFATFYAAHQLGDHTMQTDAQAAAKPGESWEGWSALGRHVGTHQAVTATMVCAMARATGAPVSIRGLAAGLTVLTATHAFWDRRWPVTRLLERTGSPKFAGMADYGMNGPYLADQALHVGCLWVAALVAVAIGTRDAGADASPADVGPDQGER